MFLMEEVGPALIAFEIITCFEANLAPKLACLTSCKDLVIHAKTSFCAMANLVGRTLSNVLTLIFGLVRNLSMIYFLFLGPGKIVRALPT
jgi:hypothetical protein